MTIINWPQPIFCSILQYFLYFVFCVRLFDLELLIYVVDSEHEQDVCSWTWEQ